MPGTTEIEPGMGANRDVLPVERFRFGCFLLIPAERIVQRDGQSLHVQPKTFDLLHYLVCHPDHLVSRDELLDEVWHDQVVSDGALARVVREVRKLLDDDAANPRFVETVQGTGFRFICPVERLGPVLEDTRPKGISARVGGLALVTFLILVALIYQWRLEGGSSREELPPAVTQPVPLTDVASLNAERFFRLGLDRFSRRGPSSRIDAKTHYEKALALNPRHAGAMAGLAIIRILQIPRPITTADALIAARPLIDRALEIDPNLGMAHAALGLAYMQDRHYEEAEAYLRIAIANDPRPADAQLWLSTIQSSDGRVLEAIETLRGALLHNPAHSSAVGSLAQQLMKVGRYQEAEELILSQSEVDDAWGAMVYGRSLLLWGQGDLAGTIRLFADAIERYPESRYYSAAVAVRLAQIGLPDAGRPWNERILTSCSPRPLMATEFWRLADEWDRAALYLGGWLKGRDLPAHRTSDSIQQNLATDSIKRGDYAAGIDLLRRVYPEPGHVVGRQGALMTPADGAQYLAYALRMTGQEAEALAYLAQIRSEIEKRRQGGYRDFAPLTMVEARNELLLGNTEEAIDLLRVAVDEKFLDLHSLRVDPRWSVLDGMPSYERVLERIETRIAAARAELTADGTLDRLTLLARDLPPPTCDAED